MTLRLTALHYHANELLLCSASLALVYSSALSTYLAYTTLGPAIRPRINATVIETPALANNTHKRPHHMPQRTLHRATALFSFPTQLRSCTMMNPWLTAGEWKTTAVGEHAPQRDSWLPYTPSPL